MDDSVSLAIVIEVLRFHKIAVTAVDGKENVFVVEGNGVLEEIKLLDPVHRQRLHYLQRKLNVAIHLFWHPEMCVESPTDVIQ